MGSFQDLSGRRFGRLVVVGRSTKPTSGNVMWHVRCDCGTEKNAYGNNLKRGVTLSCGCLHREVTGTINRRHGLSDTRTHNIWVKMRARCEKPNDAAYADYGGRGIAVCDRWRVFENFLADMGEAPEGLSINRIDNDKGYEPSNCRWATQAEQSRNRRSNRVYHVNGVRMLLTDLQAVAPVGRGTVAYRLNAGWSVHDAMTKPSRNHKAAARKAQEQSA